MKKRQYCFLRPDEIVAEKERCSLVCLPVAPLEWHGPALPLGTDGISAEKAALAAADQTGGVVLPTLWCGTSRKKDVADLEKQQFDIATTPIVGMDYPSVTVKSFYAREEVFAAVIRDYLRMLVEHQYRLIVIVTGHGGDGIYDVMERLCDEISMGVKAGQFLSMPGRERLRPERQDMPRVSRHHSCSP